MSDLLLLLLQVAVILTVSRVAGRLILPLGQPAVIGEMVAGLILGPTCFGWLWPGAAAALFAPSSLPLLNALSQIGLVLFMFLVGVRLDVRHLDRIRRVAVVTSAISVIVPFTLGSALAFIVHDRLAPPGIAQLPFVLFVGAAMSITAFPVLARILADRRMLKTEVGTTAIACAAFDDVTGWLILAGVTVLVRASPTHDARTMVMLFAGYLVVMLTIVRPTIGRIARGREAQFGRSADDLAILLFVMLTSAAAAEASGVHALFGAFFAGLMMPRGTGIETALEERLEPLTMTLLLPLFFAFTGLRTQIQLIDSAVLWRDAGIILLVAIVGKAGASTLAARMMGMQWRQAATLGVLLNTRGLMELVILNIGLELGVLSPTLFSMMVLMALVTTALTSPLVGWLFPALHEQVPTAEAARSSLRRS